MSLPVVLIPIRVPKSNMPLVQARHLRVRPGNGQTHGSAPTDAGILQLAIELVSSVSKGRAACDRGYSPPADSHAEMVSQERS